MEKPVDLFCNTRKFNREGQELFLLSHASASATPLALQQETLGYAKGTGHRQACCPCRRSTQLLSKHCCSCLGDALPFWYSWVFLRWQKWVL